MIRSILAAGVAFAALSATPALAAPAQPAAITAPEIAFTEWKLPNGLRVIALRDPTTASVTTSVWYEVGSKHDPQGRSGFSHLFEHILSRVTRNIAAWVQNGTTWETWPMSCGAFEDCQPVRHTLSFTHGAVELGLIVAVVVLIGYVRFRRSDLD